MKCKSEAPAHMSVVLWLPSTLYSISVRALSAKRSARCTAPTQASFFRLTSPNFSRHPASTTPLVRLTSTN
eukprot:4775750-Pleurochrysis_carterae.AAC.4